MCNRFSLNIHKLASSCTGLIYGVRTERHDDTTSSCVKKIFSFLFKEKDQDNPDLIHIVVSLDRGYGGCKSLINWIVGFVENLVGTMKRTLQPPIPWDAKRYNIFRYSIWQKNDNCAEGRNKIILMFICILL